MNKEDIKKIQKYIDAKIEYEFASREEGSDGYRISAIVERKKLEIAESELLRDELK